MFCIIKHKTEASHSLNCLKAIKGGPGNSIPDLSDAESLVIHLLADLSFPVY